jgi:hypothetical protein
VFGQDKFKKFKASRKNASFAILFEMCLKEIIKDFKNRVLEDTFLVTFVPCNTLF